MTIVTRRAEQRGERRRRRIGGQEIMHDRRIRARRIRELQQDKNHRQSAPKIHFNFFFIPLVGCTNNGKSSRPKQT